MLVSVALCSVELAPQAVESMAACFLLHPKGRSLCLMGEHVRYWRRPLPPVTSSLRTSEPLIIVALCIRFQGHSLRN